LCENEHSAHPQNEPKTLARPQYQGTPFPQCLQKSTQSHSNASSSGISVSSNFDMNTSSCPQSPQPQSLLMAEKRNMRSQVKGLERALSKRTVSRFPGNPIGIDVQATELALRSSRLVLEAMTMGQALARAVSRKGRDAKRLSRSHAV
jgi:hypothetical protein